MNNPRTNESWLEGIKKTYEREYSTPKIVLSLGLVTMLASAGDLGYSMKNHFYYRAEAKKIEITHSTINRTNAKSVETYNLRLKQAADSSNFYIFTGIAGVVTGALSMGVIGKGVVMRRNRELKAKVMQKHNFPRRM